MDVSSNEKIDTVPFAMYESMITHKDNKIQELHNELYERLKDERQDFEVDLSNIQDRHEKSVKRWQRACVAISMVLLAFIVGLFGTAVYLLDNFDIVMGGYSQDGDGLNNFNSGEQGDLNYGAKNTDSNGN